MSKSSAMSIKIRLLAFAAFFAAAILAAPGVSHAQIVVMVNGSPITALDIEQRMKFERLTTRKNPSRDDVIKLLIDDRLKVFIGKRYGLDVSDSEVDQAVQNMAKRTQSTPAQLEHSLAQQGISINTLKAKVQADLSWSQLVRGRYGASLKIGDAEINSVLRSRGIDKTETVGYTYKLYPITVVVPRDASASTVDSKRRIAESLRSRFQTCNEGLRLARSVRDIVVREPITRNSAELNQQLQDLLNKLEVGHATQPEKTAGGFQMFALCEKKSSSTETAEKREIREEIFSKRFEERGKKFLDEVRRSAMIEYR
ncbi:MAG: SurA N-terminal domain-containing protein [Xanthobacteraceae bacterium]|uniref:SurA N-terminal domain-containing protein n=1 Tax=Pseudolabrys sp. TaxID=1960880 RepID=UPI003D101397